MMPHSCKLRLHSLLRGWGVVTGGGGAEWVHDVLDGASQVVGPASMPVSLH